MYIFIYNTYIYIFLFFYKEKMVTWWQAPDIYLNSSFDAGRAN